MTAAHRRWRVVIGASVVALTVAAGAAEKVRFEDDHIRFVEVTRHPGERAARTDRAVAAHPSIIAVDADWPAGLGPQGSAAAGGRAGNQALPPQGKPFPWCQVQPAGGTEAAAVKGAFPQHFYRVDYQRIDGDDYSAKWREWYAWGMANIPVAPDLGTSRQPGAPFSADWPFPIVYNAVTAAPADHYLRYEDDHVQLLEVFIRPSERENIHGHPYPSVYFDDGGGFYPAIQTSNVYFFPDSPQPRGDVGKPPAGETYPQCYAAIPQAPHAVTVTGPAPQHFFRLQYKRVDGADIRNQWRTWYPRAR